MGIGSIWHWLIVLVVIVLIFGTKKLKNVGSDLGAAVKGFKDGVKDDAQDVAKTAEDTAKNIANQRASNADAQTIDVEVKEKS